MGNFTAPTRKIGSNDDFREAIWVDDYFPSEPSRAGKYGVRFSGESDFHPGDEYEIGEAAV